MESKVVAIANYFIDRGIKENKLVSNLRLQKLMYFSWGEYWVWNKEHLFEEDFHNWKYGMFIPELYEKVKAINGDNYCLNNIHANFLLKKTIEGCLDYLARNYRRYKGMGDLWIFSVNVFNHKLLYEEYSEMYLGKLF